MAHTSRTSHVIGLITGTLVTSLSLPTQAVTFQWGEIEGTFTSTLSLGASWRMEDPEEDFLSPGNTNGEGKASVSTTDDGNLNYDKGDAYSILFKGVHDLDLNAGNYGLFTRFKYWYDLALADQDVEHGHVANGYMPKSELDMGDFENLAQDSGAEFLDYYVYTNFDLGSMPVEVRAGNMVLSWGESTFIQNSVNIINPFDVTALRKPGSEIKEALLPVGMVYANLGLTQNLSLETFLQYQWERTILDECGTYWSSADVYGGGCDKLTLSTAATDQQQLQAGPGTGYIMRADDVEADDSDQYGVALRYFAEWLNATEFGLYYIRHHSRTPIFSGMNATVFASTPLGPQPANPKYFFEFPEKLELYGVSFATNIGLWAVSGEASFRPDYPLQINTVQISQAIVLGGFNEWSTVSERQQAAGPGGVVHGFDEVEYGQAQITLIRFFERVLGASRLSIAAELGSIWINKMDKNQQYGRSATYGIGSFEAFDSQLVPFPGFTVTCSGTHPVLLLAGVTLQPNSQAQNCTDDGFTDESSWGYRVRSSLDYSDAFLGVNLTPSIAWSHDVDGYSPPPNFIQGRKAVSLGLSADYLNTYKADISYTTFYGADYNDQEDRDFVSLSFSVAF